jgi:hypothetical protein
MIRAPDISAKFRATLPYVTIDFHIVLEDSYGISGILDSNAF